MSKRTPFSIVFPAYHPKAGQPTYFPQKIWNAFLGDAQGKDKFMALEERLYQLNSHLPYSIFQEFRAQILKDRTEKNERFETWDPKHHTVRLGNLKAVGEKFTPYIWSGKPYRSKQIVIYDDIEVLKTWDFELRPGSFHINGREYDGEVESHHELLEKVAKNDGLSKNDFMDWFKYPCKFNGQIICWNTQINY